MVNALQLYNFTVQVQYVMTYLGNIEKDCKAGAVHAGDDDVAIESVYQVQGKY